MVEEINKESREGSSSTRVEQHETMETQEKQFGPGEIEVDALRDTNIEKLADKNGQEDEDMGDEEEDSNEKHTNQSGQQDADTGEENGDSQAFGRKEIEQSSGEEHEDGNEGEEEEEPQRKQQDVDMDEEQQEQQRDVDMDEDKDKKTDTDGEDEMQDEGEEKNGDAEDDHMDEEDEHQEDEHPEDEPDASAVAPAREKKVHILTPAGLDSTSGSTGRRRRKKRQRREHFPEESMPHAKYAEDRKQFRTPFTDAMKEEGKEWVIEEPITLDMKSSSKKIRATSSWTLFNAKGNPHEYRPAVHVGFKPFTVKNPN